MDHPPYVVMIANAVDCQKEDGASRSSIKKYLVANYNVPEKSPYLKKAMRQLINASDGSPKLITKGKKTGTSISLEFELAFFEKKGTYYTSPELSAKNTRSWDYEYTRDAHPY